MTRNWYYWSGNREVGPLTLQELTHIAAQKRIVAETRVRQGTDGDWVAASTIAGLFPTSNEPGSNSVANPAGPPPLPNRNQSGWPGGPEGPGTISAASQYRGYLIAGVSVCALLAIVAVCMTLVDDHRSQEPLRRTEIAATQSAAASGNSNWIARPLKKGRHAALY